MNRNITATILIVLAAGIYFTVTTKILDSAKSVIETNKSYEAALESAKRLIAAREKIRSDYNNITEGDRDKLAKMLPSAVDNIRLIIDLNDVALKNGFVLKNIRVSGPEGAAGTAGKQADTKPTQEIPVNMESQMGYEASANLGAAALDTVSIAFDVSTSYQQFIKLLQALEANLRIMDVTGLTINSSDTGTYDYHVELKTYWLRSK